MSGKFEEINERKIPDKMSGKSEIKNDEKIMPFFKNM